MSVMEETINCNLLKHAAGSTMFCPHCKNVMDWKRTVIVDIPAISRTATMCTDCYDKQKVKLAVICSEKGIGFEITDGREY